MAIGIATTQNLRTMYNDMIAEALWPAYNPTVDTFPTTRFGTSQRLKGTDDFGEYTSSSGYPLVCWTYTGLQGPISERTIQSQEYVLGGVIRFAERGEADIDITTPARLVALTDCDQAAQALRNQLYQSGLTYGPFGITSSGVTGDAAGYTYSVVDVGIGEATVAPAFDTGDEDDYLAADIWIAELPVTITLWRY